VNALSRSILQLVRHRPLSLAISGVLVVGTATSVRAGFPAVVQLSSLDGTNGFMLDGQRYFGDTSFDRSGWSVSAAGDVNGDGLHDLIIGAPFAVPNRKDFGSYVVFGSADGIPSPLQLSTLDGSNGFKVESESSGDHSGYSVSSAGDVNGDGLDDLIIGAPLAADLNGNYSGRSYVVFGSSAVFSSTLPLSDLNGTNGFTLEGEAEGDHFGISVSAASDVNGDGLDDLIIGSVDRYGFVEGHGYVVFGRENSFPASMQISSLDGENGFKLVGETVFDKLGWSVGTAGDVNGDGVKDLIISAPNTNIAIDDVNVNPGRSYVVFGRSGGFEAIINLAKLDGTNGFKLDGEASFDNSGFSVSTAGDVNADGVDDIIIGAPNADPSGYDSGRSYVVFGMIDAFPAVLPLSTLDGNNGFKLDGEAAGAWSGFSVNAAGDVNGDGVCDMVIGAPFADANGNNFGRSYVVFGSSAGFNSPMQLSALNGTNGFTLDGEAAGDVSGYSVSAAGDVNGDGMDDLIIGAPLADHPNPNGFVAGRSYVVFGNSEIFSDSFEN